MKKVCVWSGNCDGFGALVPARWAVGVVLAATVDPRLPNKRMTDR